MCAVLPAVILVCLATTAVAQQPRPYTEGPVVAFAYIRTKPGMFDKYMEYLDGNYNDSVGGASTGQTKAPTGE